MEILQAIKFLKSTASLGSRPGLERLNRLLELMGNPQDQLKYVHVAGTNGKGSTCIMIASMLRANGYHVGLFTSPCIDHMQEQIQVDGLEISDDRFILAVERVKHAVEGLLQDQIPTEFELLTAAAFQCFLQEKCDIVVLETGLGGKLDATNVIQNTLVAVITNIGIDHTDYLGETIEEIAEHKAGIIKPGCEVVSYVQNPSVFNVIAKRANSVGARLILPDFDTIRVQTEEEEIQHFSYSDCANLTLSLVGEHQRKNAAVAIETIKALNPYGFDVGITSIRKGLAKVSWPARFECLHHSPNFYLDGGHNVSCIQELVKVLDRVLSGKKVILITGVMADKDYQIMYQMLRPYVKEYIAVKPQNKRALSTQTLSKIFKEYSSAVYTRESVTEGVALSLAHAKEEDIILAVGSLYMAGEIKSYFSMIESGNLNDSFNTTC